MKKHDLVLLGGGHTHVLLIKALAMRPIEGVRVTLISEKTLTPYSGMLPGFVAGHYSLAQTNIDLNQLCRKAGVRWIQARADDIDVDQKHVCLVDQANIVFDALSIDIGSTPDQRIKGAGEFTTGVKPITAFQSKWRTLLDSSSRANVDTSRELDWGVIGAGAGGVELVLAMAYRLRSAKPLRFHLIFRGPSLLQGYPAKVIQTVEQKLRDLKVSVHPNFSVSEVLSNGVVSSEGQRITLDQSIWCTGAVGAPWLKDNALKTTDNNFIKVNQSLQSVSHPAVFAVGDIAEMEHDPRPKAGVFAVRQAPWLEENLRRYFLNEPLKPIRLQSSFLSLVALGDKSAVATRNNLTISGNWVWHWKDSIDRKFMNQFKDLPMQMPIPGSSDSELMHCAGCASKLGPDLLMNNLAELNNSEPIKAEDASLWTATPDYSQVQSVDGFRSFCSNEYRFAQIAVNHALSDIYAMGAKPTQAQAWINLSFNDHRLQQRDHLRVLSAINTSLQAQGATLSGGHSSEGIETHLGIVANGEVEKAQHWPKSGAQVGDLLLLSKPLGVGVILAADMQAAADVKTVDAAYNAMLRSNHAATQQLQAIKPNAVTDVSGFGLLGHLLEMLDSASLELKQPLVANLTLADIPTIDGAQSLVKEGWRSSLHPQLILYLQRCRIEEGLCQHQVELLVDPQTSGGLLVSVNPDSAKVLLDQDNEFVVIGQVAKIPDSLANETYITIR